MSYLSPAFAFASHLVLVRHIMPRLVGVDGVPDKIGAFPKRITCIAKRRWGQVHRYIVNRGD